MPRRRDQEAEGRAMWAQMVTEVRARLTRIERGDTTARPDWVRCLQLLVTDTPTSTGPAASDSTSSNARPEQVAA